MTTGNHASGLTDREVDGDRQEGEVDGFRATSDRQNGDETDQSVDETGLETVEDLFEGALTRTIGRGPI